MSQAGSCVAVDVEMWGSTQMGTAYFHFDTQVHMGLPLELMRIFRNLETPISFLMVGQFE